MVDTERKRFVPALTERYPPGCADPDYCWLNHVCFFHCVYDENDERDEKQSQAELDEDGYAIKTREPQ